MLFLACVQTIACMDFDYVCYGGINLEGKFLIEIFYKLNNFIFIVINHVPSIMSALLYWDQSSW